MSQTPPGLAHLVNLVQQISAKGEYVVDQLLPATSRLKRSIRHQSLNNWWMTGILLCWLASLLWLSERICQ